MGTFDARGGLIFGIGATAKMSSASSRKSLAKTFYKRGCLFRSGAGNSYKFVLHLRACNIVSHVASISNLTLPSELSSSTTQEAGSNPNPLIISLCQIQYTLNPKTPIMPGHHQCQRPKSPRATAWGPCRAF